MISVCIISLWRESLYKTLETLFNQNIELSYEIVIILQGKIDVKRIWDINLNNIPYFIYNYPHDLGFWYYRNRAIEHSSGDILVWIDDDEWTQNNNWLYHITYPIVYGNILVCTAGCSIPLGQWYVTDCISLLWYPGWWALGFERVWVVDKKTKFTTHLCSGNFAIKKSLLKDNPFSENAMFWWEDNALAKNLLSLKIPILYVKEATVFHVSRNFSQFLKWSKIRKMSLKSTYKNHSFEEPFLSKIKRLFTNIFSIDRYLFGKVFLLFCLFFS